MDMCDKAYLAQCEESAKRKCFPFMTFPAVSTEQGVVMGCHASMRYIARQFPSLGYCGKNQDHQAMIDAALDVMHSQLNYSIIRILNSEDKSIFTQTFSDFFCRMNDYLMNNTFIVGDYMTIADIALADSVRLIHSELKAFDVSAYSNVVRLVNTVFGRAKNSYTLPNQSGAPVSETVTSKFNMDSWKKTYSNAKNLRQDAVPFFWENFDPESMSIWKFSYIRYNDKENTEAYKASNLTSMFLQRVDNTVRKIAFAVCNILKADGYYDIEGVMVVNLKDLPNAIKQHDQYESFNWVKLDPKESKKLIEDFFCEEDKLNGREIVDCKVYK